MEQTFPFTAQPSKAMTRTAVAMSESAATVPGWVVYVSSVAGYELYGYYKDWDYKQIYFWLPVAAVFLYTFATGAIGGRWLRRDGAIFCAIFVGMWCISTVLSVAGGAPLDQFAVKKLILPLCSFLLLLFRFRISNVGLFVYALALAGIGLTVGEMNTAGVAREVTRLATYSIYESVFGLSMGALTIVFVQRKQYAWAAVSFGFCVLFNKRNMLGAVVLVTMLHFVTRPLNPEKRRRLVQRASRVLSLAGGVITFYLVSFFTYVAALQNVRVRDLTTGRSGVYELLTRKFLSYNPFSMMIGHGPGSVERYLVSTPIGKIIALPHNEYLSVMYDYGIIGLLLFYGLFAGFAKRSYSAALLILMVTIVIFVENVFLITAFLTPFCFLLSVEEPRSVRRPRKILPVRPASRAPA